MTVRPLDEKACKKLGHVAYIREDDAQKAIRAMFNAMASPPGNAALWAMPAAAMDATTLTYLRAWRDQFDFASTDRLPHKPGPVAIEQQRVHHVFNGYAARIPKEQRQALKKLERHIQDRLAAFQAAIPEMTGISVQVRANGTRNPGGHRAHVDGHSLGAPVRVLRFLEPIESDGTLIYANDDFDITQKSKSQMVAGYGWLKSWDTLGLKRPDDQVTAYQAPANSILVISNDAHPWKPVLHNEPPVIKGRSTSSRRLLICYDISLPRDWHRKPQNDPK